MKGNGKMEDGTFPRLAFHSHFSTMQAHEAPADGESQSTALSSAHVFITNLFKLMEDLSKICLGNTRSCINNLDAQVLRGFPKSFNGDCALVCETHGIRYQVEKYLPEACTIHKNRWKVRLYFNKKFETFVANRGMHHFAHVINN